MSSQEVFQTIETDLSKLDESEQLRVLSFIQTILDQKYTAEKKDIKRLKRLIGIGNSDVTDGASEHDHYVYDTPKRNTPQ